MPATINEPQPISSPADGTLRDRTKRLDLVRLAVVGAVAVGIALRLFQYLANRSLWLDESVLANALVGLPIAEMLRPGAAGAVPPAFLGLVKLLSLPLGTSEYALRLLPIVAGIVSLPLFVRVAQRYISPAGVPVAVALFAVSPFLVYYSSEFKPYASDAAVTAVILLYAAELHGRSVTARRAVVLALAALVCASVSLPSAFLMGAVLLSLLIGAARRRDSREMRLLGAVALFWAVAFGLPYLLLFRSIAAGGYAQAFWKEGFLPFPPRTLEELLWTPKALWRIFREPLGPMDYRGTLVQMLGSAAGVVAVLLGAARMWTRNRNGVQLFALSIVLALAGSALKVYPFGGWQSSAGRVLLFLVPVFVLLMGEGVAQLWEGRWRALRAGAILLALLLVAPPFAEAVANVPYGRTESRPLLEYLRAHRRPGDRIFVNYDIRAPFRYYRERYGFGEGDYVLGRCSRQRPAGYLEQLDRFRGHGRVWVLFADEVGPARFQERQLMTDYLAHIGTRLDDRVANGASLYLYDLREKNPSPASFDASLPVFKLGEGDNCNFFENI